MKRTIEALVLCIGAFSMTQLPAATPSITAYGELNSNTPSELSAFAFMIGRYEGTGKAKLPDGKFAEFPLTYIGRYILNGTAIAHEGHSAMPDGTPYLGITLLSYDSATKAWVVEFLNVNASFIRRQVNSQSGSVQVSGRDVVVISQSDDAWIRETYHIASPDRFTYSMDLSQDRGQTWTLGQVEMSLYKKESTSTVPPN